MSSISGIGEHNIRIFNKEGMKKYQEIIADFKDSGYKQNLITKQLLFNDEYSEETESTINFDEFIHQNSNDKTDIRHYQLMEYIHEKISFASIDLNSRAGLSDWIMASLLPLYVGQEGKVGMGERYSTSYNSETTTWVKYYRHQILAPLFVYNSFGKDSRHVLSGKLPEWGNRLEQIIGRAELFWHQSVIQVINMIFEEVWEKSGRNIDTYGSVFDRTNSKIKEIKGGYDPIFREILVVLNSAAVNWNFSIMSAEQIWDTIIDNKYKDGIKGLENLKKDLRKN